MKILVTGQNGQLGNALKMVVKNNHTTNEYIFWGRENLDFSDTKIIGEKLQLLSPDIIINTAAYTQVEKAEENPEIAYLINHIAVEKIAEWCVTNQKKLIHFSTDYVFDGNQENAYKETDQKNPINIYGKSKSLGEDAILSNNTDAMIFRVSWLYATKGVNFVSTMQILMNEKEELHIIDNQIGAPTYAEDLAFHIFTLIEQEQWNSGIFHYRDKGCTNWYEFALKIKEYIGANCHLYPIKTKDYPTKAQRPLNGLLNTEKIEKTLEWNINSWEENLKKYFNIISKK